MPDDQQGLYPADLAHLWTLDPSRLGPTLLTMARDIEEMPLCAACPNARWFVRDASLHVFCKEFREEMPADREKGVEMCDAYALAIAEDSAISGSGPAA